MGIVVQLGQCLVFRVSRAQNSPRVRIEDRTCLCLQFTLLSWSPAIYFTLSDLVLPPRINTANHKCQGVALTAVSSGPWHRNARRVRFTLLLGSPTAASSPAGSRA